MSDDNDDAGSKSKAEKPYKVGYGKPPTEYQWSKGRTGNRNGRPKKPKTTYDLLEQILGEIVKVTANGKTTKMSRREAMLRKWIAEGNRAAIGFLMNRERDRASEQEAKEVEEKKRREEIDRDWKDIRARLAVKAAAKEEEMKRLREALAARQPPPDGADDSGKE